MGLCLWMRSSAESPCCERPWMLPAHLLVVKDHECCLLISLLWKTMNAACSSPCSERPWMLPAHLNTWHWNAIKCSFRLLSRLFPTPTNTSRTHQFSETQPKKTLASLIWAWLARTFIYPLLRSRRYLPNTLFLVQAWQSCGFSRVWSGQLPGSFPISEPYQTCYRDNMSTVNTTKCSSFQKLRCQCLCQLWRHQYHRV